MKNQDNCVYHEKMQWIIACHTLIGKKQVFQFLYVARMCFFATSSGKEWMRNECFAKRKHNVPFVMKKQIVIPYFVLLPNWM